MSRVIGKGRQDVLTEDVLPAFSNHSEELPLRILASADLSILASCPIMC